MATELYVPRDGVLGGHRVTEYISPSRLNLWLRCPLAFKLRYIDGIVTPTTPSLLVGKVCHAALEFYYRHRQLGVLLSSDHVVEQIDALWQKAITEGEVSYLSSEKQQQLTRQVADLVSTYLNQVPDDESRPMAVEARMEAPLIDLVTGEDLGLPLLGIVDLVAEQDDGPVIVDFKTASRQSNAVEIMHEIQLTSYAFLFRKLTGQQEAGLEIRSLIKTKQPSVHVQRFPPRSERHFARLFAVVREYLDALRMGRFSYRPGFACAWCDYRDKGCGEWDGW